MQLPNEEVSNFISSEFSRFVHIEWIPGRLSSTITDTIITVAEGNFLLAKLALANFKDGHNLWNQSLVQSGLVAIQHITPDLESFYCGLLRLIPAYFVGHARLVFALI